MSLQDSKMFWEKILLLTLKTLCNYPAELHVFSQIEAFPLSGYREGMTSWEMATFLHTSEKQVEKILKSAHRHLAKELGQYVFVRKFLKPMESQKVH